MKWLVKRALFVVVTLASSVVFSSGVGASVSRNAGKYGAMFSWWYAQLPPFTIYPPTITWDARDQRWWNAIVRQAKDAGLGWLAAACWGQDMSADPADLGPLLRAIDVNGGGLKIALFDDTTSEVLRKNRAKGRGLATSPQFDLSDLSGTGEGGLQYFYDQQWKRFFLTVPDAYRFKIDGRPVIFMWITTPLWYTNQGSFHTVLQELRASTYRDFGFDPFVIPEESWQRFDPLTDADALLDWFEPNKHNATLTSFRNVRVGHLIAGYDCSRCIPTPGDVVDRQDGRVYISGMEAIAPLSDVVLIEGFVDVDENAHLVETTTWGRRYIDLTRWYATNVP
ncbi:MAG: hypothetical protein C5B57_02995 [Blastocatellia bacterium]|nr:MAG: hypothetical protein C5B57_02995 [Blastocatellia bacterium]